MQERAAATALAGAFLAGDWVPEAMARRGKRALQDRRAWIVDLARTVLHAYPDRPADRPRELARFIAACELPTDRPLRVHTWMAAPASVAPGRPGVPGLPELAGVPDLARWLGVTEAHLAWFADRRSFERTATDERLRHYRRRWVAKPDGSARLLEAPKAELKDLQRLILHGLLDRVPRRARSVHEVAAPHVGRAVVVRCDLAWFFSSVPAGRVYGVFRWLGYPEAIAHHLAALCTTLTPPPVLRAFPTAAHRHRQMLAHLARPHLPQGAPTSPALADLCAFRLDRRLGRLARSFGGRYTRYVDDLVFSGDDDMRRGAHRLVRLVGEIAEDEGYLLNPTKTRVRTAAQRQIVTGLVVNARLNTPRAEYDRLRAILHEAATDGPEAANRQAHHDFRAHLLGRIAWVTAANPTRGAKLHATFAAIAWPE